MNLKKVLVSSVVLSVLLCSSLTLRASSSRVSKQQQSQINHTMSCNYASIKIGCKYVYGASGPNQFDCGGLVRYVAKLVGVTLTSDCAAEDFKQFVNKNRGYVGLSSQCKAGDYLYYQEFDSNGKVINNGRYKYIYHASVFVGNGQIIDASSKQKKVVKRSRTTYAPSSEVGYADAATVF